MFKTLFHILLSNNFSRSTSKVEPARLSKRVEKSTFEKTCERICPYVIIIGIIIICVLLFVALVKYGHAFSTEANRYEHLQQIVIE